MKRYGIRAEFMPAPTPGSLPKRVVLAEGQFLADDDGANAVCNVLRALSCPTSIILNLWVITEKAPPLTREQGGVIAEDLDQPLIVDHTVR